MSELRAQVEQGHQSHKSLTIVSVGAGIRDWSHPGADH
jgi:hypothetical protein